MHEQLKIISGGQTGVDRAALRAAISLGIQHGGWCPPGRESEDGPIDEKFNLKETPKERSDNALEVPRSQRTEWNVRDSDGTLILTSQTPPYDPGTEWTIKAARLYGRSVLISNPEVKQLASQVLDWLKENQIKVLNVAGPSEKSIPGIGKIAYEFLQLGIKSWCADELM